MLSGTIDPSLTKGRRVLIDGHKGTIRYIGPVPATTSTSTSTSASTSISTSTSTSTKPTPTYVGIEWDAADRGKNDGTLDGYTYFTLIQHRYDENRSTAASFLHPKRVIEGISTSLTTALTDKYTTSTSTSDMYLIAENEHRSFHVPVEFVGVSQVSQYMSHTEKLKEVVLNGRKIQYAGDDVGKKIPNVTHLDLTDNLISSWTEVAFIASPLPQLRLLNLTNNYIIPWEDVSHDDIKHDIQEYKQDLFHIPISCHTAFPHLTILILNRVPHAWSMTCLLSSHTCLPLLEELYLCHNNMTSLACTIPNMTCDVIFPSLKLLDLSNNNISEWSSLTPLSSLPHLTTLLLNDNPITSITPLSIPSLTSLSLNDCRITSLSSLDHLSSFPSLHQLHLQRNAPLESLFPRSSHLRLYLIGRFLHITTLNRSHVTLRERTDGEKFYVAHVIQEIRTSGKILTREEIQQRYARAWTLEGETLMTAISTTSNNPSTTEGTQLMNRLINITLQHGTNHVIKRVQVTDTVGNTRLAALRAFKLPVAHATQYHLTYKEKESSTSHQPMSDVMKPLSYYGVVAEGIIVLQKRTK